MTCNICGGAEFVDMKPRTDSVFVRRKVKCAGCGSLERHRLIKEFITTRGLAQPGARWLHMAPEKCLRETFAATIGDGYVCADKDITRYRKQKAIEVDLCTDLGQFEKQSFDVVIHNHVMEHLRCNYTIVLQRLHRLLRPGGWHIFTLPFMAGGFREAMGGMTDQERVDLFGQWDHYRVFSPQDVRETIGNVFRIQKVYNARFICGEERLRTLRIPEDQWEGYNNNALFCIDSKRRAAQ